MVPRKYAGYGQFWLDGRMVLAHRAAYGFANGPVPDGLFVLHACATPSEVAEAMTTTPPAEDGSGEVRNPIGELNARRAARGNRGTARGTARPAGAKALD